MKYLKSDLPNHFLAQILMDLFLFSVAYLGFRTNDTKMISGGLVLGVLYTAGLIEETRRNRNARMKAEWAKSLNQNA